MDTFLKIAIPLAAAAAIILAFGDTSDAAEKPGGARFGEPGFDSVSVVNGQNVRITGASFVKSGSHFYDATTGREITFAEAAARAVAEGQVMP